MQTNTRWYLPLPLYGTLIILISVSQKRATQRKPGATYKSEPNATSTTDPISKERQFERSIDPDHQESPALPSESSTAPRRTSFIRSGGTMPTANTAQLQLWESAASSSSNTLVGVPSNIRESVRGHIRTVSGSSSAQKSRRSRSSSVSCEVDGATESQDVQRQSTLQNGVAEASLNDPAPYQRKSAPPLRYTPWASRSRPRSASTIRFQSGVSESRQSRSRRYSTPQLSPLMPLVFQPDLPLDVVAYIGRTARILHNLHPVFYFAHIPVTLFLDFTILYALVQIALHPTTEGQAVNGGSIQGSPRINPWWIGVGIYALSTIIWFFVVFLIHDLYYCHFKVWKNRRPLFSLHGLSVRS